MTFKDIPAFRKWREEIILKHNEQGKIRVKVCITGCRANGALEIFEKFCEEGRKADLFKKVQMVPTGCQKFCSGAPVVSIDMYGKEVMYQKVTLKDVPEIIEQTIKKGNPIPRLILQNMKFFNNQTIKVSRNCGNINPLCLEEYVWKNGFSALEKVLNEMTPEEVIEEIKKSNLRGRGGAGFPTGLKWELTRRSPHPQKYLICNGDEGDPGAFMDRALLEGCPFQVIEGMLIAAYAIGSDAGYLYVRAEYPVAIEHLSRAILECRRYGLLGSGILGKNFNFDLQIKEGAGAFVCGEETALIASIEGRRGMPKPRPPFPAQSGLWNKPTCINNVETFANVPIIIQDGGENFAVLGTERSGGTKLFSLAGKVKNTGLAEVRLGIPLGKLIFDIGGGPLPGRKMKGIQIGGPSGGCLPVSKFNTIIDYETLSALGSIMGSGGIIGVDDRVCMVEFARYFLDFIQKESCGKCVPCRIGTKRMLELLIKIAEGQGEISDIPKLEELGKAVKNSSLCGLGQTAPNPVLTTLKYFREEYEEHIFRKYCRAGQCDALVFTPCENACPGEVKVSDYIEAIKRSKFTDAYRIILEDIPFPSICGRICYHPCEQMCRRAEIDKPVAIRELKRFVSDFAVRKKLHLRDFVKLKPEIGKKVAVVGGGPAGLTCAWYLSREGVRATIFEKERKLGGMLRYCVPEFRLPKKILDREIHDILNNRIKVVSGSTLGKNLHLGWLIEKFDAVMLTLGASIPQKLGIAGEEMEGVYQGLEFLKECKKRKRAIEGKKVGVVGGGNVALDCARSALRLGAEKVCVFYRRTKELMPAHQWEIEEAEKEGIELKFLVSPIRVEGEQKIENVVFQTYELEDYYDLDGRKRMREIPGGTISFAMDVLIEALGQKTPIDMVLPKIRIDTFTLAAEREKIFVGGDFFRGPSTVIEAIGDGKRAARSILKYLTKEKDLLVEHARRKTSENEAGGEISAAPRQRSRTIPMRLRKTAFVETETTFTEKQAILEAKRCLRCQYEKKQ